MKTNMIILGLLLAFMADAAQAETLVPSQEAYRTGIEQLARGELHAASESFYQAIALDPEPEAGPNEYLPYLNLSIALFEMGQTRAARDSLIQSQVYGVAASTETGTKLLNRYAAEIMSAPLDESQFVIAVPVSATENRTLFDSDEKTVSPDDTMAYSDSGFDADRKQKRCASTIIRADDKLPWFFYYQCGVVLMQAGDAHKAISAFEMGANALDDPSRGKRMYGMWFVDYLPYYQIALAHSQLGDWESANTAIQTSVAHGEFSPTDPDYETFTALDQLIKSNLKNNDS